jgi:hypothetical protein
VNTLDFWIGFGFLAFAPFSMGLYGGYVAAEAITDPKKRRKTKVTFWALALLGILLGFGFQYLATKSDETNRQTWERYHREDLEAIEKLSKPGGNTPQNLADAWGKISSSPPSHPIHSIPFYRFATSRRRAINAEDLAKAIKASGVIGTATVINDGTVGAGAFAKQLEIGMRMGGWTVGGDNVKMGDPEFFPDALTVEISSNVASADDKSTEEAKVLIAELKKLNINAVLRFTDLTFPPNFMRIKVAGQ